MKRNKEHFYGKVVDGSLKWSNLTELVGFLSKLEGKDLFITIERVTKIRSYSQNNALHKFFELLADEFNDAGYTVQMVLKKKVDLDWDKDKVKELLWRPAQKAILGKKSTVDLDRVEDIDIVYEHLNRHIAEKFGIHVPFPHDPKKQHGR